MFSWFKTPDIPEEAEKEAADGTTVDETNEKKRDDPADPAMTADEEAAEIDSNNKKDDPTTTGDDDEEEEGADGSDESSDLIRHDICNALQKSSDAWNRGDLETYLNIYSQTARYTSESLAKPVALPEDLILRGKGAIVEVFSDVFRRAQKFQEDSNKADAPDLSSKRGVAGLLEYSNLEVTLLGEDKARNALVFGHYRMELSDTVIDTGVFTLHMVLEDDNNDCDEATWRVQSEHSSAAPK